MKKPPMPEPGVILLPAVSDLGSDMNLNETDIGEGGSQFETITFTSTCRWDGVHT
jgi:hypothetical protein